MSTTIRPGEIAAQSERARQAGLNPADFITAGYASGKGGRPTVFNIGSLDAALRVGDIGKRAADEARSAAMAAAAQASAQAAAARAYADEQISALRAQYEEQLKNDREYSAIAEQIRALTGGAGGRGSNSFTGALSVLNAQRNLGTGDLANRLNFEVQDQQILDDVNSGRLERLRGAVNAGNARAAFLTTRIADTKKLMEPLPAGDARRKSSEVAIKQLEDELADIQKGLVSAQKSIDEFTPLTLSSQDGQKLVSDFREYIRLPEERAMRQIRQIDPDTFDAVSALSGRFRDMASQDVGSTADPRTEQLRGALEDLAFQELQLGGRLSPEETRAVQQAVRGRQAQLGNVEGMGPFSEEFAALGLASDNRRLARAQNALSLLASGQTRSDELRRDQAFRDSANLARMGAASDFVASGPSAYNLANLRTNQQQAAFNAYVNANQINPGAFSTQANQVPGYMYADPNAPVQMAGQQGNMFSNLYGQQANFASNIYGSQADYGARTYGAQVDAQSRIAQANSIPNYISAFSSLVPSFSF